MGPGGPGTLVGASNVDLDDEIPVLVGQVLEANVTQDTGVVDENIDATKGLEGGLNDSVSILDTVVVSDGLAARSYDLVDDHISSLERAKNVKLAYAIGWTRHPFIVPSHLC